MKKNEIRLNESKSAATPLVKNRSPNDKWEGDILNIPIVERYKYLGITITANMKIDTTIEDKSKLIRTMNSHKVLGSSNMPLKMRLNTWRTYYYSKVVYPLLTLRLTNNTKVKKIQSRISMSLKNALSLNIKLSKDTMC